MRRTITLALVCMLMTPAYAYCQSADIDLPKPEKTKGKPLMQALSLRRSTRSFADIEISEQELSNLLWAANGINRPESGGRTAPSAMGSKEITVYVARRDGLYQYDPDKNSLIQKGDEDIRKSTGKQDFTQNAPVNLIYVADFEKMHSGLSPDDKDFYAATDTGFVSQNVYLYCASEGLVTVVLNWVDKEKLHARMGLTQKQKIILTQPVGYPDE